MNQNQPILVADNDPEKLCKAFGKFSRTMRIVSAILIVLGSLFAVGGFFMVNSLGPYADDSEILIAVVGISIGLVAVLVGIFYPSLQKKTIKNGAESQELHVYNDHIEGKGTLLSGATQTLMDFHETYDRIESISTTETHISFNMQNGNAIRCIALNAEEIGDFVRSKLN